MVNCKLVKAGALLRSKGGKIFTLERTKEMCGLLWAIGPTRSGESVTAPMVECVFLGVAP